MLDSHLYPWHVWIFHPNAGWSSIIYIRSHIFRIANKEIKHVSANNTTRTNLYFKKHPCGYVWEWDKYSYTFNWFTDKLYFIHFYFGYQIRYPAINRFWYETIVIFLVHVLSEIFVEYILTIAQPIASRVNNSVVWE